MLARLKGEDVVDRFLHTNSFSPVSRAESICLGKKRYESARDANLALERHNSKKPKRFGQRRTAYKCRELDGNHWHLSGGGGKK